MSREAIEARREQLLKIIREASDELVELEQIEWELNAHGCEPTEEDWRLYCEAAAAGAFDFDSSEAREQDRLDDEYRFMREMRAEGGVR